MKEFTLFWLNGKSEIVYGSTIEQAIQATAKKGRIVYYTEDNCINDYEFDKTLKFWSAKPKVQFNLDIFFLEVHDEPNDSEGNTIRSFFIDDTGLNKLMVKQNDKLIILTLKLGNLKPRHIGTVTKSTKTVQMVRDRTKNHLFREGNAYGFGYYVLKNQSCIDWVRLSDNENNYWKIPVKYIIENGRFMNFKQQGFELQKFVSLNELEQFRVYPEENRRLDTKKIE